MENRSFYNEILTEHNVRPEFKHDMEDADIVLEGVNPSCGDDIFLKLKTDGDTIVDGAFVGDGCAISQASADAWNGYRTEEGRGPGDGQNFHEDDQRRSQRGGN